MKYSKKEILRAAEIGEVSMIDAKHVVSLLDEAKYKIMIEEGKTCNCAVLIGTRRVHTRLFVCKTCKRPIVGGMEELLEINYVPKEWRKIV
jgi:hypothetical protein